jgi:hypothetical protein
MKPWLLKPKPITPLPLKHKPLRRPQSLHLPWLLLPVLVKPQDLPRMQMLPPPLLMVEGVVMVAEMRTEAVETPLETQVPERVIPLEKKKAD